MFPVLSLHPQKKNLNPGWTRLCLSQACHGGFQAQLENRASLQTDSASFLRHWVHRLHQIGTALTIPPTLPTCLLRLHLPPPSELLEVNAHPLASTLDYTLPTFWGLCNYVFCFISKRPDTGFPRSGVCILDSTPLLQLHLTPSDS